MPAEWSEHSACLLLYPHNIAVFRGSNCEFGKAAVMEVAKAISQKGKEPVFLCCCNEEEAENVQQRLEHESISNIHACVVKSDDTWARDTGPTFLTCRNDGHQMDLKAIDWGFNAYGGPEEGCYWPCENDTQIAKRMITIISNFFKYTIPIIDYSLEITPPPDAFILEGGSIHVDGEGTILTTEECLLNSNRNPTLTKAQIESKLLHALGGQKVIWLPRGLYMDEDTNGHVDNLCCFVQPGNVVLAWTHDQTDPQYNISNEALTVLEQSTDAQGRRIKVTKLINPPPLYYTNDEIESFEVDEDEHMRAPGSRLAASYVNFYIANDAVIVPGFGCRESDDEAVATLESLFAPKQVIQIASREIVLGGGNIHCITQQVPKPMKQII